MGYNILRVEEMRLELRKTIVISEEFKMHLVQLCLSAYQEGVDDGIRQAKGEDLDAQLKRKGLK